MTYFSRRKLYALGETLGECSTRRQGGRTIYGGGGGGSSSSSSSQTTNNTDARVVGGDNSQNFSAVGNDLTNSTINLTDHGAVAGALDLAKTSLTTNQTVATAAMGTTKEVFQGALNSVEDAYATAKAGDQKIVAIAGMAVVGLAAATLLKKG